jgi:hypothetical protein
MYKLPSEFLLLGNALYSACVLKNACFHSPHPQVAEITLLVMFIPVPAVKVSCLLDNAVDKVELSTKLLSLVKSDVFSGISGVCIK